MLSERHFFRVASVCLLTATLSACSGFRLYNETRDKQGEAAKKAWDGVDLKSVIATERQNLNKLLEAELATQDKLFTQIRENEIKSLLEEPVSVRELEKRIADRLDELTGGVSLDAVHEAKKGRTVADRRLKDTQSILKTAGFPAPTCPELQSGAAAKEFETWRKGRNENAVSIVEHALKANKQDCIAAKQALQLPTFGGEVGEAQKRLKKDNDELSALKNTSEALLKEYKKALEDYTREVSKTTSTSDLREKAKAVVSKIETARNALATEFLSKERLESLDNFLRTIVETKPGEAPPEDASQMAKAFILFPALLDQTRQSWANAKKPLVTPLLLTKNYEELRLEAARRDVAATEASVRIAEELVGARLAQADQLDLALRALRVSLAPQKPGQPAGPSIKDKYADSALPDVLSTAATSEKVQLYNALARYLDALGRLQATSSKLSSAHAAAHHERALAYAEVNIKQWDSLIGSTVNQLAEYGSSGIKTERITNLLNTTGLFWIGAGVNK